MVEEKYVWGASLNHWKVDVMNRMFLNYPQEPLFKRTNILLTEHLVCETVCKMLFRECVIITEQSKGIQKIQNTTNFQWCYPVIIGKWAQFFNN